MLPLGAIRQGENSTGKSKKEACKTKEYGHLSLSIFRMPSGYDRIVFKLLMGLLFYPKVNIFPPKSIPPSDKCLLARRFLSSPDQVGDDRQPMIWRMASMRSWGVEGGCAELLNMMLPAEKSSMGTSLAPSPTATISAGERDSSLASERRNSALTSASTMVPDR